ncbi:molybdopterin-guanine dinucleotide biosynthesis protein MobB [Desulfonatronum thioautotrophicum]|uniref:molybdopterin-guanine dinucleotide biosynthesis protein MobB n=1 Tax=Desulfonatronum thioautotrophicum TaxID=617001 RepID=UPI0005EBE1A6|nr:molybdopterin-guanine dinucleotide biosynthesis protein MobB [Desulfonatronum thioautotrophicum]
MTTRAMGFVGFHNSGKTTLVVRVAEQLRRLGHRVGIIKSSHHPFDLGPSKTSLGTSQDNSQKNSQDTSRLAATGCAVAGIDPRQTLLVRPEPLPILSAWSLLDADILLIEGGKGLGFLPRIILQRTEPGSTDDPKTLDSGLALAVWEAGGPSEVPVLTTVEAVTDLVLQRGFLLPALDCGACGRKDCRTLAQDIVAGLATPEDCRAMSEELSVRVNGVQLGMNPFVASIMASTIRGMLCQLKGYAPGTIDIHLESTSGGKS